MIIMDSGRDVIVAWRIFGVVDFFSNISYNFNSKVIIRKMKWTTTGGI